MKLSNIENKTFNKGLRGYDVQEVNKFIVEVLDFCSNLETENKELKEKVEDYHSKEELIKEVLMAAQQTASDIKKDAENTVRHIQISAENTARDIQTSAENKAKELIKSIEEDSKDYRDNVHKCYYSYERELRLIIDRFYSLSRNHMQQLEKTLTQEIQTVISRFDNDYNNLPKVSISIKSSNKSSIKYNKGLDQFKEKEYSLLLGHVIQQDILDSEGCIVANKGTVITPEVIEDVIKRGVYGELIEAVEKNKE